MSVEIADAYIALYTRMPGVKKDIERALDDSGAAESAGLRTGNKFSAGIAGAIGGAAAAITSKAIDMVAQSIDGAIARVDIMRSFPKVMENFGYSADDASASINKISDGLQGLPTSVDSLAGMVQQLAPLTGSLDEATDLSLAFNNALLAGGKSTDMQANAMEQYTQMLAVGKVDMAAWRSMVSAMPGQMNQLAESLIGAGAGQNDLYEAMQNGTISFDEFNNAVMDLNENGVGAFASFQDQAVSATDGIATSQQNMQTAITRGLANIIDRFQPQITAMFGGITDVINIAFNGLAEGIDWMSNNMDIVVPILSGLAVVLAAVVAPSIWAAVTATWAWTAALLANPITWIVLGIAALVAGIVWLVMNWDTATQWLGDIWNWLWESVIEPVVNWIVGAWNWLVDAFTWGYETILKPVFDAIAAVFDWIYNWIIKPIIFGIILYITIWATIFTWLYENIVKPVFDGIAAVFQWIWDYIIMPIVDFIVGYIQFLGSIFTWLYENVVVPIFDGIAAVFDWIYNYIITPIVQGVIMYINMWAAIFTWLYENVVTPIFNGIGAVFTWLYESVIKPVWSGIQSAISVVADWITNTLWPGIQSVLGWIGDGFENMKSGIVKVWEGIKQAAIEPVNFVINSVYNDGIRDMFNQIAEAVGLGDDIRLPYADPIKLASGGVLPGWSPGRDIHKFWSPTGGALHLSGGEAIMRPEFTAWFGRSGIAALNAAARTGRLDELFRPREYADGGIWDAIGQGFGAAGDWLSSVVGSVAAIIADPLGSIDRLLLEPVQAMLANIGGGTFGQMMAEVPLKIVDGVRDWFAGSLAPQGVGGDFGDFVAGPAVQRVMALMAGLPLVVTDTYRTKAQNDALGSGEYSYHRDPVNPAIDVAGPVWAMDELYARILANGPWRQVLYRVANHFDHVHAASLGSVWDAPKKYDNGGWLAPGRSEVVNLTGKPEAVLTAEQWEAVKHGRGVTVNQTNYMPITDPNAIADRMVASAVRGMVGVSA